MSDSPGTSAGKTGARGRTPDAVEKSVGHTAEQATGRKLSASEIATDKLLQGLANAESKNVAALAFSAQEQKIQRKKDKSNSFRWKIATIMTIVGIVGFIAGNIYIRRFQYPALFKWYDGMRKQKTQGEFVVANYSMYQVTTVMQFEPVGYLLSLTTIWTNLDRVGAEFLAQCVSAFGDKLTALHWNGSASQTNADKLIGANGWASSGCPNEGLTSTKLRQNLIQNWSNSGKLKNADGTPQNIWYDLMPDPLVSPDEFANLCVMKEIWEPSGEQCPGGGVLVEMCTGDNQSYKMSHIWMLFDGGLCNVAYQHTNTEVSAGDLFSYFFVGTPTVPINCGGSYAAGAVSGATGAASSMLGVASMATDTVFLGAAAILTVAGGVAGALAGGAASKQSCEQKAG